MEKKIFFIMMLCLMGTVSVFAQADKLLGNYFVDYNGKQSKVKIYKQGNKYFGQVYWSREDKNPDGTKKLDVRNPDKSKRNIPVDQCVIISNLQYDADDAEWDSGKIYDPTSGKTYSLDIRFKDATTLELHGKLGPFYKKIYWKKIQEK